MPNLDLNIIPTYNKKTIGIADNSTYEKTPSSPTIEITVPGYDKATLTFTPNSLAIYNSNTLNMTDEDEVDTLILPDGVWEVKYSVVPNYESYVTINFLKTDLLEEKFYNAFLSVDVRECEGKVKTDLLKQLNDIQMYITGAVSSAKVCNLTLATKLYRVANERLDKFLKTNCYGMQYC